MIQYTKLHISYLKIFLMQILCLFTFHLRHIKLLASVVLWSAMMSSENESIFWKTQWWPSQSRKEPITVCLFVSRKERSSPGTKPLRGTLILHQKRITAILTGQRATFWKFEARHGPLINSQPKGKQVLCSLRGQVWTLSITLIWEL